ncbi:hypothetical protein K2173_005478 [Erythroxylum novogranatense]|uniref:Uncharacterized protein n=1 Tax=Erythroxylum novogranatense TaxID=1862640 RepID=A0AAV8SKL4_9ROSI|nr:hypothetical protein K2173_005478 [Erythroxylum novogranatense]
MAFRSTGYWKSMVNRLRSTTTYATSTTPKLKAYAPSPSAELGPSQQRKFGRQKGEFVPVYVAIGMIILSTSLGLFTAKHQMMHSPGVRVKKKTRETIPELVDPDRVMDEADRFVKKSFFRKVGHVQEFDTGFRSTPNPNHKDAFAHGKPKAETLKSIGVDPQQL